MWRCLSVVNRKKAVSVLLASSLLATPIAGQFLAVGSAQASTLSQAEQTQIQAIIDHLRSNGGYGVLEDFSNAVKDNDDQVGSLFGDDFFPVTLPSGDQLTEQESQDLAVIIVQAIGNPLAFHQDVDNIRVHHRELFHKAFGNDVTVDTLRDFAQAVVGESQRLLTSKMTTGLSGVTATSLTTEAIRNVLNSDDFASLNGKLGNVGLSVNKLIEVKNALYSSSVFGTKAIESRDALVEAYASQHVSIKSGSAVSNSYQVTVGNTIDLDLLVKLVVSGTDLQVPITGNLPSGLTWAVDTTNLSVSNTGVVTGNTVSTGGKVSVKWNDIKIATVVVDVVAASTGGGGGGGGGAVTPPAAGEQGQKVADSIKSLLADGKVTGKDVKDLVKSLQADLKTASAADTKSVLEAISNEMKAADTSTKAKLAKTAIFAAEQYVKKSALEQLKATLADGKAEARVTADQLKSVVDKAVKALEEAKSLLTSAGVNDSRLRTVLSFDITDATNDTAINLSLTELQAALSVQNLTSTDIGFQVDGVTVVVSASDIFNAITSKDSVAAAAAEDDYTVEIVQSDLTNAPGAGLNAISGVKVIEVKGTSKNAEVTAFSQPVQVVIEVGSLPSGTNEDKVAAYQLVDGKWVAVGGVYEDGTVTFKTSKPGQFTVFVSSKSFADIGSVSWAKSQIESMVAKGVVNGRSETKFAPNDNVTRAEFATLLVRAFGLYDENATSQFSDVKSSDWFRAGVASAAKHGIVSGVAAGKFNPNAPVTRAEMATMAANALKTLNGDVAEDTQATLAAFADNANIPSWAKDAVALAVENEILKGMSNNSFAPNQKATRAQAAVVIYGLYNN